MSSLVAIEGRLASEGRKAVHQRSLWSDALDRFLRNKAAVVSIGFILFVILTSVFGPVISPYDYAKQDLFNVSQPPSRDHWFGTDALGRDYLTRILMGGRTAFLVAIMVTGISTAIGVIIGSISAYKRGLTDSFLMRCTEVVIAFPNVLLAMFIAGTVRPQIARLTAGNDWLSQSVTIDYITVFGALAIVSWPYYARMIRGQVLSLRETDFIEAERMMGASTWRIIKSHLLPNAIGPIIVAASASFGSAMLLESSLSFLGIGIRPPGASWGNMINENLVTWRQFPFLLAMPGIVLSVVVLAFSFLGDGLNDALNPRARR